MSDIDAEGPMMHCRHCGGPICRLFSPRSDYYWKRHYDMCEAFAATTAAEDAYYRDDFTS